MTLAAGFPPETLRQYTLLADGERGAVVGPRGDIAFLCAPRWHDPAVFSSLIGGRGHYAVSPTDRYVWGGYYEPGSLIWRSRWVTAVGVVESREALALPADRDRLVLLRRVEARHGPARLRLVLDPCADFGARPAELRRVGDDVWEGRSGGLRVRWRGAPGSCRREDDGALVAELEVPEGTGHDLVLEISAGGLPRDLPPADRLWEATEAAWQPRSRLRQSIAPADVDHGYAVLRGLTSGSAGMVAAATMSLPERAESGRNYDYRYAWIRDQCYAGEAAAVIGATDLLDSAASFVAARLLEDGPTLRPAYTVDGGAVPDESSLSLPGYPGGSDKVGNWVNHQFQLDAFGEALLLLAAAAEQDLLGADAHQAALTAGRAVAQRWRDPDAGLWELDDRLWTHSRLMCAAGLRRFARVAPGPQTSDWEQLADRIVAETSRTSLHASGRWQRAPDDERVDAALLLPGLRGATALDDPRSVRTVEAVRDDLADDHFVYRFRHQAGPLGDAEGAFLLCGFHLAMATHRLGRPTDAVRWFERSRGALGPPGLFTEEFDVVQRQLRGNLPQAFVHAALMEAATRLASPPRTGTDDERELT